MRVARGGRRAVGVVLAHRALQRVRRPHAPLLGGTTPATKTLPVARRVLGEGRETTLRLRWNYAMALYKDAGATLDDLREAVTTLEETERMRRRVFGGAHPLTEGIEDSLRRVCEIRERR